MTAKFATILLGLAMLGIGGCIGQTPSNPAATQPVTQVDPKLAEPAYWLDQPATATAEASDFDALWNAAENVARRYLFEIDLRDYRNGLMKTKPVISKQFFEVWRKDAGSWDDVEEASLGTIRRTIIFQFTLNDHGSYSVAPKVLVERQSKIEPKYRPELDSPVVYWYALRRDTTMEQKLVEAIQKRLEQ